jgi:chromosome segregation ATPase
MEHLERIKSAEEQAKEAKNIATSVKEDMHKISGALDNMSHNFSDLKDTVKSALIQISSTFDKMSDMHSELQVLTHDARIKDNHNREEHSRIEGRVTELSENASKAFEILKKRMDDAQIEQTRETTKRNNADIRLVTKTIITAVILAVLGLIMIDVKH